MNIQTAVERHEQYAIELRRRIHRHPELSLQEYETTALIREELEKLGIRPLELGLETGIAADIIGTKPGAGRMLAIRADIDALPIQEETGLPYASERMGISHACGHDLHTAALMLTARVLSEHREEFSGRVRLMFQPAEEKGNGAKLLIEHGVLENPKPDLVLGLHTWPDTLAGMIGVRLGASHASSDTIRIRVIGKGGHGAHPYRCIDPIVTASYLITQMQTIVSRELSINEGGVLTFGMIRGGTAPNVIPGEVEIQGTLRALDPAVRAKMQESLRRVAEGSCAAMGARAEVEFEEGMPPLVNDIPVISAVRSAAEAALGTERVVELKNASPGSDDFAVYLEQVPGALFRMGTGNEDPATHIGLHNGKNRFDERGIAAAASTLVSFVCRELQ